MIAWITGSGSGNGRRMALRLAEQGYDVGLHCSASLDGAEETKTKIEAMGRKAVVVQADLSKLAEIERLFEAWEAAMGAPDLFVNNSGITKGAPFLEMEESTYETVEDVNIKGAYFCMQRAARVMVKHGVHGSIIAIASNHAYNQFRGGSVYAMMKAAMVKLIRHIALELAQYKIRANVLAPGWILADRSKQEFMDTIYPTIPMRRWVRPEEIADTAIFLASSAAQSITGECILMDGGTSLISAGTSYGFEDMQD